MTPMEMDALSERMWNANVRIEQMFWLGGGLAHCPTSAFRDFIEDELPEDAPRVLEALPFLKGCVEMSMPADEVAGECGFHRKSGFIVQLATPIPYEFSKDGKSHSLTWGRLRIEWVYADTLAEICEHAERFATKVVEAERKKSKKIA